MDTPKRKSWQESVTWFLVDGEARPFWEKAAIQMPRVALWMAVFLLASMCSISATDIKGYAEIDKLAIKTAAELFGELPEIKEEEG
jgi:hypothetical protein